METVREQIYRLTIKDNTVAYHAMQSLQRLSAEGDTVYPYMDAFFDMISSENSYIRTRGLLLIAANAKWDTQRKIDERMGEILGHILDPKPITARQCIEAMPQLAAAKPELKSRILIALRSVDLSCYSDSMQPMVEQGIRHALERIDPRPPLTIEDMIGY